MIASLRRRHCRMITTLFIVVVASFAWALAARKVTPTVPNPPGADVPAPR